MKAPATFMRDLWDDRWDSRCPICEGRNDFMDAGGAELPVGAAEVVDKTTGRVGLAHVECYLGATEGYELA